jgi:hypothetical protein
MNCGKWDGLDIQAKDLPEKEAPGKLQQAPKERQGGGWRSSLRASHVFFIGDLGQDLNQSAANAGARLWAAGRKDMLGPDLIEFLEARLRCH